MPRKSYANRKGGAVFNARKGWKDLEELRWTPEDERALALIRTGKIIGDNGELSFEVASGEQIVIRYDPKRMRRLLEEIPRRRQLDARAVLRSTFRFTLRAVHHASFNLKFVDATRDALG